MRARTAYESSAPGERHQETAVTSRNAVKKPTDDLRPEYDLARLKGGVRGKYYRRATAGTTPVLLEPDVAAAFPDGRSVNTALRALLEIARSQVPRTQAPEKVPHKRTQSTRGKGGAQGGGRARG